MKFSPSAPAAAAGIVATTMNQATRSLGSSIRRRRTLADEGPDERATSRRK